MKDQERKIRHALRGKVDKILLEDSGINPKEKKTAEIHIRVQPSVKALWEANRDVVGGISDHCNRSMTETLEANGHSLGTLGAIEADLVAMRTYADERLRLVRNQRAEYAKQAQEAAEAQLKEVSGEETVVGLVITYSKILVKERNRLVLSNQRISDSALRSGLIAYINEQPWLEAINGLGVEMDANTLFTRVYKSDAFSDETGNL